MSQTVWYILYVTDDLHIQLTSEAYSGGGEPPPPKLSKDRFIRRWPIFETS